jgi:hypothetical protein
MRGIERRLMRRLFTTASFVLALFVLGAPAASADPDPDLTPAVDKTITCDGVEVQTVILNGGIHLADGNSMFLPKVVSVNGVQVVKNPGFEDKTDTVTCTWLTASLRTVVAVGFFTPASS